MAYRYIFGSRADFRRAIAATTVLLAAFVAASILLHREFPLLYDVTALRAALRAYGPVAPLVYIGIMVLQIVIPPLPAPIIVAAGGYAFGGFWGTVYGMIGALAGSIVNVVLGRRYGRPFVERVVDDAVLQEFDVIVDDHGATTFFLILLLPGFPDNAICYMAGLTRLRLRTIVGLMAVGHLPGLAAVTVAGDLFAAARFAEAAAVTTVVAVVSVLSLYYRDRIIHLGDD